jgi:DNA polymerase
MSDARERLRRYLEQRRELGESELVLDGMSVDDVLRVVSARGPLKRRERTEPGDEPTHLPPPAPAAAPAEEEQPRSALPSAFRPAAEEEEDAEDLAADVADDVAEEVPGDVPDDATSLGAPADHPRLRATTAPDADASRAPVRDVPGSGLPARPTPAARATPEAAGAGTESGDWRAALRAAGADEEDAMPTKRTGGTRASEAPDAAGGAGGTAATAGSAGRSAGDGAGGAAVVPGQPYPGTETPVGLIVGAEAGDIFGGPLAHLDTLERIAETVQGCTRCPLFRTATNGVPGEGHPQAELMVVGEAPGADEDASGRPFVGASGQLLTKILAAIKLAREDVFIANVVKHRPPGNRNPAPDEVAACSPYLIRQIELVRPKVILTVGNFAAQTLLDTKLGIGKLRGLVHVYHGVPLVATYHPAALLRNPTWKRPTWEDVQLARRLLDRTAAS